MVIHRHFCSDAGSGSAFRMDIIQLSQTTICPLRVLLLYRQPVVVFHPADVGRLPGLYRQGVFHLGQRFQPFCGVGVLEFHGGHLQ